MLALKQHKGLRACLPAQAAVTRPLGIILRGYHIRSYLCVAAELYFSLLPFVYNFGKVRQPIGSGACSLRQTYAVMHVSGKPCTMRTCTFVICTLCKHV